MKKFTILFLTLFLLFSCWKQEEVTENVSSWEIVEESNSWNTISENSKWIIENTTNIINDYYIETLPWAIRDAKDVVNDINIWYENMQKEINSLR
jgi:hypothetical protein